MKNRDFEMFIFSSTPMQNTQQYLMNTLEREFGRTET